MLQRFVDHVLAVTKESVKTVTYESLNSIARLINGVSALLLTILPGKANLLEGIHGWELRPTFRGPRLPRWMENGVSSFNEFIHELSVDSDTSSTTGSISSEDDNDDNIYPASPLSQSSRLSRRGESVSPGNPETHQLLGRRIARRSFHIKDHVVQRTTDRRRGVFEDLQLAIEIFIESVFETVHNAAHLVLSPSEVWQKLYSLVSLHGSSGKVSYDSDSDEAVVPTATVGSVDPTPAERRTTFHHSLNTDSRTCEDVITELGYPYEAIRVVTDDGYVLLLERIPRRDSHKVVYLQHGILDSSMGWVSNGVVGSPAFAAYDQGYDVFLGNLRGLVSREHVDKNISSRQYWKYSLNEHGTKDVPAIIEKIHEIKTSELSKNHQPFTEDDAANNQPYKLCAVCHSLGGAAMLMYVITRRMDNKPHRLSRLILLSPAGFHEDSTILFTIAEKLVLLIGPILAPIVPGLYIPTRFFRMLLNKLARDFHNYPALGGLVQTLMGYVVGGDSSNWVGVLGLPHYNMYDMPGVSFYVALHLAQIKRARKFIMYDYGSASANMEADSAFDGEKALQVDEKGGVAVSYNEFEYAHLDFTFSHREELLAYVMSRLNLIEHPQQQRMNPATVRLRKLNKAQPKICEDDDNGALEGKNGTLGGDLQRNDEITPDS
uniref:Partial AB-hydrolase lipase domain-containing protein n=1 Tax=Ananas comosus var. bracteatus TaxID=296719 RepID=A0A6V7PW81_ANACO|nr:unnamed protein product [Ananas comosus var. bracteatus]